MKTFITGRTGQNREKKIKFVGLMVILIVIFTVITFIPLRERLYAQSKLENANPPKAAPEPMSATAGEKKILIVVNRRGEIFIEKKRYTLSELKAEIPKLMENYPGDISDVKVYVRTDANTPYITLANVISGIKETGVKKIWLVTKPVVASKSKQPVRKEVARKDEIKASQLKEIEPKNEERLRTKEQISETKDVASLEVKKKNKEEATEAVKPTEPSAITPPKEIEKSQEPVQEQASGSTKEEVKPQSEKVGVPEEAKKAEVKKEEKVVANVNYLGGIKITKWSLYAAWGFSTIHHVTIENTNDTAYKNIKIRASYYYSYSTDYGRSETGEAEGILPITLPPHSTETYLGNGTHLQLSSACSMYAGAGGIEILGATPIEETNIQSSRKDELLLEFTDDGLFLVR